MCNPQIRGGGVLKSAFTPSTAPTDRPTHSQAIVRRRSEASDRPTHAGRSAAKALSRSGQPTDRHAQRGEEGLAVGWTDRPTLPAAEL